jgi:glycosyltransferase involved in cell wall biosynthesis
MRTIVGRERQHKGRSGQVLQMGRTHQPQKPKVIVVMPAYNAACTLERTYRDIPAEMADHVILVDDASRDSTVEIARRLGLRTIAHKRNRGYGGNQKTCYLEALGQGADVVVMLHPDYQYDATRIPQLIAPILAGTADLVLGSRLLEDGALAGGMPLWKYIANRGLTALENRAFRLRLSEYHTGFRAYSRRLLQTIPFLLNAEGYAFDSQVIAQAVAFGFRLAEIPVPTRYFKEASSIDVRRSVIYGLATVATVLEFLLDRWGMHTTPRFRAARPTSVGETSLPPWGSGLSSIRSFSLRRSRSSARPWPTRPRRRCCLC